MRRAFLPRVAGILGLAAILSMGECGQGTRVSYPVPALMWGEGGV
jgi:hypothetical protein